MAFGRRPVHRTIHLHNNITFWLVFAPVVAVAIQASKKSLLLQLDEIGRRFTGVGGSLQMLSREVAVMTKKLEQLLQQ